MTSYPKAIHGQSRRSARPRKRKSPWCKNQEKEAEEKEISNTSASSKKLSSANVFDAEVNRAHAYKIIEFLSVFKKITRYYGLAISRNTDLVQGMKKAIQAILDHLTSTDETPKHGNCPAGADSWCKWRKAKAAVCAASFKHPPPLYPNVEKHLQPIFDDLSNDNLLEKCLGGYTQNANENFNSTVWRLSPTHIHNEAKIVCIAAYIAASIFNEGYNAVLMMMNKLGIQAHNFAVMKDEKQINRQNRRSYSSSKEARTARRMEMMAQNVFYEEEEGLLYAAGIAD
ncbi:hypothetical protein ALC62_10450 [Cyphomyrmex costatus]|uniref:Mutator-like transposase domain-containing protein n=1 Tax=Cyphomyrmex costatus TaxID=456900 RepID=A0A151IDT8_9HYME|nr:hypothetical protein ALC62_10450 [Cyphomyrmex costatus]